MNNAKPERDQDIATRCFMNLLRWLRVVLFQDAVFLRKKYPALKIWLEPVFNNPVFETFAQALLHEAEHGETPHFVRISKAMPDLAHQLREQHGNMMNTMSMYHQSILNSSQQGHTITSDSNRQEHALTRNIILQSLQPFLSLMTDLSGSGVTLQTSSETHVQLADSSSIADILADIPQFDSILLQPPVSEEQAILGPISELNANTNSIEQYRLATQVKTVTELWTEYAIGIPQRTGLSGPSIQQLDNDFGAKWRTRDDCRKAYSRRRHIWEAIKQAAQNLNLAPQIIAEKMERWRQNQGYALHRLNSILADSRKQSSEQSGLWGHHDLELLNVM
jgi:hypothetical protein